MLIIWVSHIEKLEFIADNLFMGLNVSQMHYDIWYPNRMYPIPKAF